MNMHKKRLFGIFVFIILLSSSAYAVEYTRKYLNGRDSSGTAITGSTMCSRESKGGCLGMESCVSTFCFYYWKGCSRTDYDAGWEYRAECEGVAPPPPPPPPPQPQVQQGPYCGDRRCDWTYSYKEACKAGTHPDGTQINACTSDCRQCREDVYPGESTWCKTNCMANNGPTQYYPTRCGDGFGHTSLGYTFSDFYCPTPPPGETCGTCKGEALCGDGRVDSPETCDDGNRVTESCSYGSFRCTVCDSGCRLVSGITSRCGDGKVASPETCDDGNRNPGDGCNSNCGIEPGFTCNNNQQPSSCGKNIDVCFDGIDNNANGVVDENCGGCADYNSDNKVDFDDFLFFDDCVGATGPGGACTAVAFSKSDWDDDRKVEGNTFYPKATRSDFNNDGVVNNDDMAILADNFEASGSAIKNPKTDIDKDGVVDFDDFLLYSDDFGLSTAPGDDQRCIMQQLTEQANNPGKLLGCSQQQQCAIRTTFVGGTPTAANKCLNSFYCNTDAVCSFSEFGKTDTSTYTILPEGREGVCCSKDTFWNGNTCEPRKADPCTCNYKISQKEFWNPASGCINVNTKLACLETKLFSRDPQKLTLDILKR